VIGWTKIKNLLTRYGLPKLNKAQELYNEFVIRNKQEKKYGNVSKLQKIESSNEITFRQ